MKVLLFHERPPDGRCLLLARELSSVINDPSVKSVALAERMYDCLHYRDNPLVINVSYSADLSILKEICSESGIIIKSMAVE